MADETTDVQHAGKNLVQLAHLKRHHLGLRHQARRPEQRRARARKRGRIPHAAKIRRGGRGVALRRGAHEDRPGQSRRPCGCDVPP